MQLFVNALHTANCILKDLREQDGNPDTWSEEVKSSDGKYDCTISWLMQHPLIGAQANHCLLRNP